MSAPWSAGLRPELAARIEFLLWATRTIGFPCRVSSGYRSTERQAQLYAAWIARGKTGLPAARPGTSRHELGEAVDVVWQATGVNEPFRGAWSILGAWAEQELGLRWGGLKDPVHFELPRFGSSGES